MNADETKELTKAILAISQGDVHGPGGLEGLSVAVAGMGLKNPVGTAISEGLRDIAEAIHEGLSEIAEAVRKSEE